MILAELCKEIILENDKLVEENLSIGTMPVSIEYSKSFEEIKHYPSNHKNPLYFLCWYFKKGGFFSSATEPSLAMHFFPYRFEGSLMSQLHKHDFVELGYVVKGNFKQKISNRDVTFNEGDFCLIDKNCVHQDYLQDQDAIIIFFGISNVMLEETLDETVTTHRIISFIQSALSKQTSLQQFIHFRPKTGAKEKMDEYIFMLVSELYQNKIGSQFISKGYLLRIFHLLSKEYDFMLTQNQHAKKSWLLFEEVCEYIKEHYQDIKITDLTQTFHFQKDYFNRLIKKYTGLSFSEYVQNIRLNESKRLLLSTELNISEIAEQIGYHNKGYFYKIFTEKFNMTPAEYRKTNHS